MRASTYGFLMLAVCVLAAVNAPRASAQPAAGCDATYLREFSVIDADGTTVWEPGEMECVEYFRFTVTTPGGPRTFRGIGDLDAGALLRRGDLAQVEAGARRAAANLAALGDYRIDDVTYLISLIGSEATARAVLDPSGRHWDGSSAAWTLAPSSRRECPVMLFLFGPFTGDEIQYTVAHETFHCVEHGTLSPAQRATLTSGGAWWGEGAAELFAGYTVRSLRWNSAPVFRGAVEAQQPLYAMTYEASIFFYWHYQKHGLSALVPFLRRMAGRSDAAAQRAALRSAIPSDALLQFAKDFDDNRINYPNGPALDFGPKIEGERWTVARNSTLDRTLKPFVIMPGWTDYECGKWANTLTPRNVNAAVRNELNTDWSAWPNETDCRAERRLRYRVMTMHTGDTDTRMSLRVERRIACDSCLPAGENHIDACLVGTWELTSGGPMEWMARRMGRANFRDKNSSKMKVTMFDNGMYRLETQFVAFSTEVTSSNSRRKSETQGQSMISEGFWSAKDGKMRACSLGVAAEGTTTETVTTRERTSMHTAPTNFATGPTEGESKYTCSATTYTSSIRMNDGSNMDFTFTRLSPPPPPPSSP
jgi:hypothetical protein